MQAILRTGAGLFLAFVAVASRADGFVNVYEIPYGVSLNVIGNQLTHEIVNRTVHHWDKHAAEQKAKKDRARSVGLASSVDVAQQLARGVPEAQAPGAEATYKQALHYHELVIKKFGLPSGDLGVAIASSIAGAWMAYHNKPFPDQYYVPLVRQMQQKVNTTSQLKSLSPAERQVAYEGLAIAGMMLASSQITWARNRGAPGAADLQRRMRSDGGAMLTRMLRVSPERVGIGASGFTLLEEWQR